MQQVTEHERLEGAANYPPGVMDLGRRRKPKTRTIEQQREDVRARLAFGTLMLLATTIGSAFGLVGAHLVDAHDMLQLMQLSVPAEIGLAGSAIAFYFGGRERENSDLQRLR